MGNGDKDIAPAVIPGSEMPHQSEGPVEEGFSKRSEYPSFEKVTPEPYIGSYKLTTVYGQGAWSAVYRALENSGASSAPLSSLTPPTSPSQRPGTQPTARVFAVKTPISQDAHPVLTHEARILTYLSTSPLASTYTIKFFGFVATANSIVLAAEPLTLEAHARSALKFARENFTTRTMFNPVIGLAEWRELARGLVEGLNWLHEMGCVHGDVKPANILLSPDSDSKLGYWPLYCDFSSSRIVSPSSPAAPVNLPNDAITPAYTAPELLAGYGKADAAASTSVATFATDVFSLGVTLIAAAIGESPYESARGEMQKLAMARQGKPLEFARGTEQATRVMKGREVERWIEGAVRREGRWTVEEWVKVLEGGGKGEGK
jgi:serine/threonine protein kinase